MCASLKDERLEGFGSYSAVKTLSVISIYEVNTNILAPELGALEIEPTIQNDDFFQKLL
jgi:hypothetical protein